LSCGRDTPSVASERAHLVSVSACFTFDSLVCEQEYFLVLLCDVVETSKARNVLPRKQFWTFNHRVCLKKMVASGNETFNLSFLIYLFMNTHTLQNDGW